MAYIPHQVRGQSQRGGTTQQARKALFDKGGVDGRVVWEQQKNKGSCAKGEGDQRLLLAIFA